MSKTILSFTLMACVIAAGLVLIRHQSLHAQSQDALSLQFDVPKVAVWSSDEADIICIERHDGTQSCYKTLELLGGVK